MILQDPKFSLNPVQRVGDQIAEAYPVHHRGGRGARRGERALEMLEAVQIRDPERVYGLYPHEISGGMGQRVMIAMMLIPEPDAHHRRRADLGARRDGAAAGARHPRRPGHASAGIGLIFISHDLNLVRNFCDRVLIMYAGRVVEALPAAELDNARHPYTPRPAGRAAAHRRRPRAAAGAAARPGLERPLAEVSA